MKRTLLILALAILAAGAVFGAGKTIVYGTTEKVTDMDPAKAYDFHTWEIFYNVYQGLLNYAPGTTRLVPGLAESYGLNKAGEEFTFKLRKGVKFTDGTPFDCRRGEVVGERVMALKGDPSWLVTDFVERVEVVDQYTVKFILRARSPSSPHLAGHPAVLPAEPQRLPRGQDRVGPCGAHGRQAGGPGRLQD